MASPCQLPLARGAKERGKQQCRPSLVDTVQYGGRAMHAPTGATLPLPAGTQGSHLIRPVCALGAFPSRGRLEIGAFSKGSSEADWKRKSPIRFRRFFSLPQSASLTAPSSEGARRRETIGLPQGRARPRCQTAPTVLLSYLLYTFSQKFIWPTMCSSSQSSCLRSSSGTCSSTRSNTGLLYWK